MLFIFSGLRECSSAHATAGETPALRQAEPLPKFEEIWKWPFVFGAVGGWGLL